MNDITKLPKWAQDRIVTLENTVRDLERHGANEYTPLWSGDEPQAWLINTIGSRMVPRAIGGTYCRVVFRAGDSLVEVFRTLDGKAPRITISARDLAIHPVAANAAFVTGTSDTFRELGGQP